MAIVYLRLLDSASACILHDKHKFGKKRLRKFHEAVLIKIWDAMEYYSSNPKDSDDYRTMASERVAELIERRQNKNSIETTVVAMERDLGYLRYDYNEHEAKWKYAYGWNDWQDREHNGWIPAEKSKLQDSRIKYAKNMESTCRVYIMATLLYLNEQYTFGPGRMQEIHWEIGQYLNQFNRCWVNLDDKSAFEFVDYLEKRAKKCGVEVTYWEGD